MSINPVVSFSAQSLLSVGQGTTSAGASGSSSGSGSFSNMISQALQGVSNTLSQADSAASSYALGGNVSIEQVMLAEQKATLAVDAVTEIQKHVVQSYQAVMNMQV